MTGVQTCALPICQEHRPDAGACLIGAHELDWDRVPYEFPIGKVTDVKILKLTDFGAFAEIIPGVEGLIHISEISEERIEDPRQVLEPGQAVRAEVIQLDAQERKIGLSIKSARRQDDLADAQGFANVSEAGATLGDLLSKKLKK